MRRSDGGFPGATSRRAALAAIALATVLALLLPGAAVGAESPSPSASAPIAADYAIGVSQDCDGLNPFSSWSGVSWECFRLGYDFLTWYDEDYQPAPDIASSWETSDDGLTWTFHVRRDMKWHDGVPLTAHDVAFTYQLVLDTQEQAYIQYLTGVSSVTAPDDETLVITTREPSAEMLAIAIPILPEHIWKKVDPDRLGEFANLPFVGSGPFRPVSVDERGSVRLEANTEYPYALGGAPHVGSVTFVLADDATLSEQYRNGTLDAVVDVPATALQEYAELPGTTTVAGSAIGFHELGFNCWTSKRSKGNPLLRDASIRRAVHWAIDKRQLAATAMAGLAEPATALLGPAQEEWQWDVPAEAQYRYQPQRAKQILDDAGYRDADGDGVREDAVGRELSFRLVALDEYPQDQAAAKMVAGWCRDVGIRLRVEAMDERAFGSAILDDANYDLFIWSWGGDIDPGFILSTFTTRQIMGWSDSQYSNRAYDRLFVKQADALDLADPDDITWRKTYTDAMQKILYRDNPYVVLWYNVNVQAYRTDRWTGYALAPSGDGAPFWNQLRTTYIDLRPLHTTTPEVETSRAWMWLAVAGAIAAAVLALALRRRKHKAVEHP